MTDVTATAPCAISPRDKKAQAKRVGDDLVRHHGKRDFHSVLQVGCRSSISSTCEAALT